MCGAYGTEIDHVHPRALGGSEADSNLQLLCRTCHAAKTRKDIRDIAKERRRGVGKKRPVKSRSRYKRLVGGGVVDREADDLARRRVK